MENGSTVIRTAGVGHSKSEIKKDFDYLIKSWNEIREITLKSTAPSLIHEEASIIKRAIRDLYSRDVESILIEGEEGYRMAKDFIKKLMPTHSKKVKLYYDKKVPLFSKYKINDQVNQIYSTRVDLPSGGYIIVNTTEALISIDVNSGRSTRERNIGGTALKTNLEAAMEIARQCRLRDLAGLIVVDFIDMEEKRNNAQVEKCLRDALREDKAKIQIGTISNFGLLEFSRQRLRSSIVDANMVTCPHCNGVGSVWSDESIALQILRKIEETCFIVELEEAEVTLSPDVALYLLNNKRAFIASIENRGLKIVFKIDPTIAASDFRISQVVKTIQSNEDLNPETQDPVEKNRKDEKRHKQARSDVYSGQHKVFDKENKASSGDTISDSEESNATKPTTYATRSNRNRRRNYRQDINENITEKNKATDVDANKLGDDIETSKNVFDLSIKKTAREDTRTDDIDNNNVEGLRKKNYRKRRRNRNSNRNAGELIEGSNESSAENLTDGNIDFREEKDELAKLAKTYRELEQSLEQINSQEVVSGPIKRTRKEGWWQRLIKKPSDQ